jgi:hypothetical protein
MRNLHLSKEHVFRSLYLATFVKGSHHGDQPYILFQNHLPEIA